MVDNSNPKTLTTDQELVEACLGGEVKAFDALVERHQPILFSFAKSFCRDPDEAQDAVQETLLYAFRKLATFRGDSSFRTWIIRIAIARAIDIHRKRIRNPLARPDEQSEPDGLKLDSLEQYQQSLGNAALRIDILRESRKRLCDDCNDLIRKYYYEHEELVRIAERMSIPSGTIQSKLHRCRNELRQIFVDRCEANRIDPLELGLDEEELEEWDELLVHCDKWKQE